MKLKLLLTSLLLGAAALAFAQGQGPVSHQSGKASGSITASDPRRDDRPLPLEVANRDGSPDVVPSG